MKSIEDISKFISYPNITYEESPCTHCYNNPKNGGSGICWCTLGTPKITC